MMICSTLNRFFGISVLLCQANSLTSPGPKKPGQVKVVGRSVLKALAETS